jgi:hypothetical protein
MRMACCQAFDSIMLTEPVSKGSSQGLQSVQADCLDCGTR